MEVLIRSSQAEGDDAGIRILAPTQRTCFIGRKRAGIRLSDEYCSARHAVVYRRPGRGVRIRDLASRNGTFVNGNRIIDAPLRSGDEIRIGKTILVVNLMAPLGEITKIAKIDGESLQGDACFRRDNG